MWYCEGSFSPIVKEERVVPVKDEVFNHVHGDEHSGDDRGAEAQEAEKAFLRYEVNRFGALEKVI